MLRLSNCLAGLRPSRQRGFGISTSSTHLQRCFIHSSPRTNSGQRSKSNRTETNIMTFNLKPYKNHDVIIHAQWIVPSSVMDLRAPSRKYIVLLHSALGCISTWKDFPSQLAEWTGLPVLAFDRQGHGKSSTVTMDTTHPIHYPRTSNYLAEHALVELPAVLQAAGRATGISGPPVIHGHSDGGTIALLYASEHACEALVTEAPHVFVEPDLMYPAMEDAKRVFAAEGSKFRSGLERHHGPNTEGVFYAWAGTWTTPEYRDWNMESCLSKIKCPTVVIQGDSDEYATLRQVDAITSQVSGPAEQLVLPGIEHHPHHEARDAVLRGASDFLARHSL